MADRVEIKTVGKGYGGYQVVYLDGVEKRRFSHVSDDYSYTNAREYARKLRCEIKEPNQ